MVPRLIASSLKFCLFQIVFLLHCALKSNPQTSLYFGKIEQTGKISRGKSNWTSTICSNFRLLLLPGFDVNPAEAHALLESNERFRDMGIASTQEYFIGMSFPSSRQDTIDSEQSMKLEMQQQGEKSRNEAAVNKVFFRI